MKLDTPGRMDAQQQLASQGVADFNEVDLDIDNIESISQRMDMLNNS